MRTKLITALRLTANAIENGTFSYDWRKTEACNCGALACTLMGASRIEMEKNVRYMKSVVKSAVWSDLVGAFCPITGMPENEVLRALMSAGMTSAEIAELEFLKNKEVRSRMKNKRFTVNWFERKILRRKCWFALPKVAVEYMRCWADLIQERERDDSAPAKSEAINEAATSNAV